MDGKYRALFICAVILILVVLIQKGKGGGLSGAFGGGMAGGILGSKTGDFLTWFTIALVGLFLFLAVVMAKFYKPSVTDIKIAAPPMPGRQAAAGTKRVGCPNDSQSNNPGWWKWQSPVSGDHEYLQAIGAGLR